MSESLYFIALVPTPKIKEEVTQLKILIAERFHSKQALKSPPHITLHMPFKWKKSKLDKLKAVMEKMNSNIESFNLELDGFSFFEPRVVYVDVKKNEALESLQKRVVDLCRRELNLDNANYKDRPFRPHMTIGFRDLRKPEFYEAKKYFQKRTFEEKWKVEKVSLLKYSGSRWEVISL